MWFSNTTFDIKMCFSKRWQNWWSSTPLPHDMVVESRENFRGKEGGGNWVKCHAAVWGADFSSPGGEKPAQRGAALGQCLGGKCCVRTWSADCSVWALLVDPGYFNHETSDKQWIMWLYTFMRAMYQWILSLNFNFLAPPARQKKRQNWVISSSPSLLPHPANFKTAKTKTKPETAKCLILVCCSNGEILQGHRIGLLFHFWCVEMSMQIASLLYFVCFSCVLLLWKKQQSSAAQSV